MPIQTGPSKAELLYQAIGESLRGLGLRDRMRLLSAISNGEGFAVLPPALRDLFERCAARVGLR